MASVSRPARVRRVASTILFGLRMSFMSGAALATISVRSRHPIGLNPMPHRPSPHPVGKSGLDRRPSVQRSQYDDRGDCGASKLRRDIWSDTGEAQNLDVQHLSS